MLTAAEKHNAPLKKFISLKVSLFLTTNPFSKRKLILENIRYRSFILYRLCLKKTIRFHRNRFSIFAHASSTSNLNLRSLFSRRAPYIFIVKVFVIKRDMRKTFRSILVIKVIGEMLFIYGLLGWIYGVAIQFNQPMLLPFRISHLFPWLRVDTFTILSFLASALGFLIWRLSAELIDCSHDYESH